MNVFIDNDSLHMQGNLTVTLSGVKEGVFIGHAYDVSKVASLMHKPRHDVAYIEPNVSDGNGLEALKEIKKINRETPVIMLAVDVSPLLQRDCAPTGTDLCLDKDVERGKMALITQGIDQTGQEVE
jgi:DNA-binding NarL/FixJ family response regulator